MRISPDGVNESQQPVKVALCRKFTKLTKALQTQTEWADRYKEAHERTMKRSLWERIINKKTYL